MSGEDAFYNLEKKSKGLFKEKGSSFLSYAWPIYSEADFFTELQTIRKEHPKARHICYAYRYGPDKEFYRLDDNGEPGGTAGKPILGQLIKYNLENTAIAVVRYFGGTLLGTSGLLSAYKSAAESAIINGHIVQLCRRVYFQFNYEYQSEKIVDQFLKIHQGKFIKKTYSEYIDAIIGFPISTANEMVEVLKAYIIDIQWKSPIYISFIKKDIF